MLESFWSGSFWSIMGLNLKNIQIVLEVFMRFMENNMFDKWEKGERIMFVFFRERERDHISPSFVGFFSWTFDGHVTPLWALDLVQRDSCTGFPMVHHMPWPLDPNFNPLNTLNLLKSWSLNLDRMATSVFFIFLHF